MDNSQRYVSFHPCLSAIRINQINAGIISLNFNLGEFVSGVQKIIIYTVNMSGNF